MLLTSNVNVILHSLGSCALSKFFLVAVVGFYFSRKTDEVKGSTVFFCNQTVSNLMCYPVE